MGANFNTATSLPTAGDSDSAVTHPRSRKIRPAIRDLPFPRGGIYIQLWRTSFVPSLLAWAGAQVDAFGINGKLESMKQIGVIWRSVFPDLKLDNEEENIVVYVVRPLI
jgi:hypothetical protein